MRRITKTQLARLLGIAQNSVYLYARGESMPPVDKAIAIAQALDCSVYDIWGPGCEEEIPGNGKTVIRNIWRSLPTNEGG